MSVLRPTPQLRPFYAPVALNAPTPRPCMYRAGAKDPKRARATLPSANGESKKRKTCTADSDFDDPHRLVPTVEAPETTKTNPT